jgi:hypothetical protein
MSDKKVSRTTLKRYAGLLGTDSLAACALRFYDQLKADSLSATIYMHNSGFSIKTATGTFRYG